MTRAHAPFFFTDADLISGNQLVVTGSEAGHLKVARRGIKGDDIKVCDGNGTVYEAEIVEFGSGEIVARIKSSRAHAPPVPSIGVIQGLAKGSKLDFVVQKLVEVGVRDIVLFQSSRSVPRWDIERSEKGRSRLATIALQAAKQSHSPWLPKVSGPLDFSEALKELRARDFNLVAHEKAQVRLREALPEASPAQIGVIIGPEGGLSEAEVEAFLGEGAVAVSLGERILRTETAALALVLTISYRYGLIG